MSLKSIFILSVIILNGVFHCPETHSKTTTHDCVSHHECVLEEENSCPELIKRALKKKKCEAPSILAASHNSFGIFFIY